MFSGQYDIKYFCVINDKIAVIQWNPSERSVVPPGRVNNVFIIPFTTAYTRLTMHSYLQQLQKRLLYTDIDSLIYVVRGGETP